MEQVITILNLASDLIAMAAAATTLADIALRRRNYRSSKDS